MEVWQQYFIKSENIDFILINKFPYVFIPVNWLPISNSDKIHHLLPQVEPPCCHQQMCASQKIPWCEQTMCPYIWNLHFYLGGIDCLNCMVFCRLYTLECAGIFLVIGINVYLDGASICPHGVEWSFHQLCLLCEQQASGITIVTD